MKHEADDHRGSEMGNQAEEPSGPNTPRGILPYGSSASDQFAKPVDEVFGQMGKLALVLALVSCSYAVGLLVASNIAIARFGNAGVCCFGFLPWIVSLAVATRVSLRDSVGRKWALSALLIDLGLMFAIIYWRR